MKETLLIIPGFRESGNEPAYKKLKKHYQDQYTIVIYRPKWDYNTATIWLAGLNKILNRLDSHRTTVVSFSLGSYITLLAAENTVFKKVLLCSLSPFFKEQLSRLPKQAVQILGVRRINDFRNYQIPNRVYSPCFFMFGSDDWDYGINEAKRLAKKYHSDFIIIPSTPHELTDVYIEAIISYL